MKIAFIGTYPPRQCGIGTFTNNLVKAVVANTDSKKISKHAMIVAINEDGQHYNYPDEVKHVIRQNHQRDYIDAAKFINYSDAKVCVLEHEFGIFGGDDGVFILPLLHRLEVPLIVTFHTVLRTPSYTQRSIVEEIGKKAARIVVMSKRAVDFLADIYKIPREKIALIEHGVPEFEKISHKQAKQKHGLTGRKILLTFGLLSRNKGIETAINALPRVVEKHPDLLYIVLGATHPNVLKQTGDEYRDYLKRLVKKLGLEKNVHFNNEFVSETKLFEYLNASDIYLTPYLSEAQITSGTLSYAVGAGCAVVSTPYWHAQELLADDRGRLFDFKNSEQLAQILNHLLDDEDQLALLRKNAFTYGKKIRWPKIGKQYLNLANYVSDNWEKRQEDDANGQPIDISLLPAYNLEHVKRLTDDTGIVQHAKYGIPNLKEGYCVDDNSRALLMALMAYRQNKDKDALRLMPVYLSFIHYMQRENGDFRNFLSFSRQFLDEYGSEDSFGRTIWALGYLLHFAPNDSFRQIGRDIFFHSTQHFKEIKSIRGAANTIIGISYYLKEVQNDEGMVQEMNRLVGIITSNYEQNKTDDWKWFEKQMSYDNAIIPLALFSAYEITGNEKVFAIAMEAAEFLESQTMKKDYFRPIGNKGWLKKGEKPADFDQQSIDVMAMILLYNQMFLVSKKRSYIEKMFLCYLWFLGENSLRLPLFDHETQGCCDGLETNGVNRNQGAESTLAYWISHVTILSAQEKEHIYMSEQPAAASENNLKIS
ncbi:Glycosyltransferase involved in cell wall bisynthesis [Mariniphaga anaerophila]|uniref:Glycosyltransferase involved in cell wall bisynthesis n=1 Tax=Mariniphaga anaerophila TaxID=1484053 RepID=A0A1M5CHK1_9BACT|nr:glycosyltransferase family 4 protein [Mariniphaga anaerophila]SHF54150.1 Glycosyltransferase involved in cell wall bisynthesis [Mariniphaga anaerophila]